MTKTNQATKQAGVKVSPITGTPPPVERQFGKPNGNPRHNGAWKKEDTARYKLEQMLKMTEQELDDLATDINAPHFERKLAICIREGKWKEIEGMMNQVYGFPKQEITNRNIELKPILPMEEKKK